MIAFRNAHQGVRRQAGPARRVDLEVQRGEVLFIIGTSGVGKSVTIKHLVGLLRPDDGEIWLDGERVDTLDERALYAGPQAHAPWSSSTRRCSTR